MRLVLLNILWCVGFSKIWTGGGDPHTESLNQWKRCFLWLLLRRSLLILSSHCNHRMFLSLFPYPSLLWKCTSVQTDSLKNITNIEYKERKNILPSWKSSLTVKSSRVNYKLRTVRPVGLQSKNLLIGSKWGKLLFTHREEQIGTHFILALQSSQK